MLFTKEAKKISRITKWKEKEEFQKQISAQTARRNYQRKRNDLMMMTLKVTMWMAILTLCYAEGKVVVLSTTSSLSTFTNTGLMYNDLFFGHLVIKVDLNKIEERRNMLMKLQEQVMKLPKYESWSSSQAERADTMKVWMNQTLQHVITKVNISLNSFQEDQWNLVPSSTTAKPATSALQREQRQVMIAAGAGLLIGGVLTAVGSYLHEQAVIDILEDKVAVITSTIENNLVKLNQHERDLELINGTVNEALAMVYKVTEGYKGLKLMQNYVTTKQAIDHFAKTMLEVVDALEALKRGEFSTSFLEEEGLKKAAKHIEDQARAVNRIMGINTIFDLNHLDTSYGYFKKTNELFVINSIPLLNNEKLQLYAYSGIPVILKDGKIIKIDHADKYLAISKDQSHYTTYENLNQCTKYKSTYICEREVSYKRAHPNCLKALFLNEVEEMLEMCEIHLLPGVNQVHKINSSHFVTTSSTGLDITINCEDEPMKKLSINGTNILILDPGCLVSTKLYNINRPKNQINVELEKTFLKTDISLEQWIDDDDDDGKNIMEHLKVAESMLKDVGKPINTNMIKTLTVFQKQMRQIDAKAKFFQWFSLQNLLGHFGSNVVTIAVIAGICFIAWKCGLCNCRRCRQQQHQHQHRQQPQAQPEQVQMEILPVGPNAIPPPRSPRREDRSMSAGWRLTRNVTTSDSSIETTTTNT